MTTLDKLTPTELRQHYGCWVETPQGRLGILVKTAKYRPQTDRVAHVIFPNPNGKALGNNLGVSITKFTPLRCFTLRKDLPRAWETNGEPNKEPTRGN